MCNLHDLVGTEYLDVRRSRNGSTKVYPNYEAPVIRSLATPAGIVRDIVPMRRGFPAPPFYLVKANVTNVRNTASNYWKPYLKAGQRCLVPATAFSEPDCNTSKHVVFRFARPGGELFHFAGIWREWEGDRNTIRMQSRRDLPPVRWDAPTSDGWSCRLLWSPCGVSFARKDHATLRNHRAAVEGQTKPQVHIQSYQVVPRSEGEAAMPMLATITIAALAEQAGVDITTINHCERLGLLDKPRRIVGGLKLYRISDVARLTFFHRAKELGFSTEDIRELLGITGKGPHTCSNVYAVADRHLRDIRRRLAALRDLESVLAPLVADCPQAGSVVHCPIVNAIYHPK